MFKTSRKVQFDQQTERTPNFRLIIIRMDLLNVVFTIVTGRNPPEAPVTGSHSTLTE